MIKNKSLDKAREEVRRIDFNTLKEEGIERTLENFYILGNYPPLMAMNSVDEDNLLRGNTQKEFDIYLHFQYCNQLCNFCHFYMDQRAKGAEDSRVVRYLDNLKTEISMLNERIGGIRARSVYVGGGTPSFMSSKQIRDLFAHLYSEIDVPKGITITFDVHPEIVRGELHKLDTLVEVGVNRIAIGGVDLDDKVLQAQQRGHTSRELIELIQNLKLWGFPNIATDLIIGAPYQTPESWEKTVDTLVGDVCNIDCAMTFPHMFKASQPNWIGYQKDSMGFPSVEDRAVMQLLAMDKFDQAGYSHIPLYYFNRESKYINDQQLRKFESLDESGLLAIGVSSFGFINGHQYFNIPNIQYYNSTVEERKLPVWMAAKLTPKNNFERAVMFGLKSRGVKKKYIEEKYGYNVDDEYKSIIKRFEKLGLLISCPRELRLSRLGILFAEEICDYFAGDDVRERAEGKALLTDPKDSMQRHNYNMIGHRLK